MAQEDRRRAVFGGISMQKCQHSGCQSPATLHITEIQGPGQFEEVHLCEQHAAEYAHGGGAKAAGKGAKELTAEADEGLFSQHACPNCGIKFVDFRNSGRLGCPNDYSSFREDLLPLLENIHGETRHCGKTPRRYPQAKKTEAELTQLRNRLKQAVTREDYEEAARLRDKIRQLEEA
jgi:protein arginine kinase activator